MVSFVFFSPFHILIVMMKTKTTEQNTSTPLPPLEGGLDTIEQILRPSE